jgi:phosphoribosylanthranilate isomerase
MRIKICGITQIEQGKAIAEMGATALGFICVTQSPRYIKPIQIREITLQIPSHIDRIGVFVNPSLGQLEEIVKNSNLTGIQLHGEETPEFCQRVKQLFPDQEIIKAFRVKNYQSLLAVEKYFSDIDSLLLDAYHPHLWGGTGATLDWKNLQEFRPPLPWFLAGGLNPDNILQALAQLQPDGIDLSSGVERSPGDKDLTKVQNLFDQLQRKSDYTGNIKITQIAT